MIKSTCLIIIFLLLIFNVNDFAQKVKFGKVSMEELQMTVYSADSTAEAVILYDKGSLDERTFKFTRHIRIKILKKSGLEWGNWSFNTPTKSDIRVEVFNLQNGEITKSKADKNSIYEEEVIDKFSIYKVFAPNVKIGSVIDISYYFAGIPLTWRFQERIPIKYSELYLPPTDFVKFNKTLFGFEPIDQVSDFKWVATNMPAFEMEPYLSSYQNYITKFEFHLISIGGPEYFINTSLARSWANINRNLMKLSGFGGVINSCAFLNKFAKQLQEEDVSKTEKINRAYQYVKDNIKWNGVNSLIASVIPRNNFLNDHSGNSADINLILIALLRKLNINAFPVVLSTRDNGLLMRSAPSYDKLNYVVAYIKEGDIELLLDASCEHAVPGILPERCLNQDGLIVMDDVDIMDDVEIWIPLNRTHKLINKQYFTIKLKENDQFETSLIQKYGDYGYLKWLDEKEENTKDAAFISARVEEKYADVEVMNYEVDSQNKEGQEITELLKLDIQDKVMDVGNEILFSPALLFEFDENPFKSEVRKYPLDITYPADYSTSITLALPPDYNVIVPESIKLTNSDQSAVFTYIVAKSALGLQIKYTLSFNRSVFTENEYLELRSFMSEIIKKLNTPIEIDKNT